MVCQLSVVSQLSQARRGGATPRICNGPRTTDHGLRHGFTLIEVLIVIGIIIMLVALSIPAFSVFRGERSTEAAENQLSAMMARARTESIGFQRAGGVLFFRDPREPDRVSVAQVWQSDVAPTGGTKEV